MSKIDYDLTKIRAFAFDVDGVLSPSIVPVGENGVPARMANVKDGYAMQLAIKRGYLMSIITGADTEAVRMRYELLGITDIYLRASHKLRILRRWMSTNGLEPEEVLYAGDDVPDIECMRLVGLSVAPADASVDAKNAARYISPCNGGHGVARDVIEQTMRAQNLWLHDSTALSW
ncbi:MAG: HAD hydrolase family protein [Muribaculaceae bacterium]|nr:HAD hydrolase family protein [Muribaculaceae bacterium]MDE6315331.1 HAD hydrolase family protein [Muribaculaceae bacterium]